MKTILTIIFCITNGFIFSQNIVDTHKVWSIVQSACDPSDYKSFYIKFNGDTTVDSYTYKKIYYSENPEQTNWTYHGLVRENNGRVYSKQTGLEYLLYDFNVNIGDTVQIYNSDLIVAQVDTVNFADEYRKRILLHYDNDQFDSLHCESWFEGIGSLCGVIYPGEYGLIGGPRRLICYTENDILIYQNPLFSNCFPYPFNRINNIEDNVLSIFPNPTKNSINIYRPSDYIHEYKIEVLNVYSILVYSYILADQYTELNITKFKAGLYFCKIYKDKELIRIEKLIII